MARRFQFVCIDHLCHFGNLPFLHTAKGRGESEYDVVPFGRILRIVRIEKLYYIWLHNDFANS